MDSIKLVCFDMDGTLIEQNSWYALNTALGVTPAEDLAMYEAYGAGELSYEDWISRLVSLYKERGVATRENVTAALTRYQLRDGAVELVEYLKGKGYRVAIVSGSFDVTVDAVAGQLGITLRQANTRVTFGPDGYLTELVSQGDEKDAKVRHLETICNQEGIKLTDCVCIGDGGNDIELFNATKHGIAFTDAPAFVREAAWKVVEQLSDIKKVL